MAQYLLHLLKFVTTTNHYQGYILGKRHNQEVKEPSGPTTDLVYSINEVG